MTRKKIVALPGQYHGQFIIKCSVLTQKTEKGMNNGEEQKESGGRCSSI